MNVNRAPQSLGLRLNAARIRVAGAGCRVSAGAVPEGGTAFCPEGVPETSGTPSARPSGLSRGEGRPSQRRLGAKATPKKVRKAHDLSPWFCPHFFGKDRRGSVFAPEGLLMVARDLSPWEEHLQGDPSRRDGRKACGPYRRFRPGADLGSRAWRAPSQRPYGTQIFFKAHPAPATPRHGGPQITQILKEGLGPRSTV